MAQELYRKGIIPNGYVTYTTNTNGLPTLGTYSIAQPNTSSTWNAADLRNL